MTITSSIPGVEVLPLGHRDHVEERIIKQYRSLRDSVGRHSRPFTIVILVDEKTVSLFSGSPQGRLIDTVE